MAELWIAARVLGIRHRVFGPYLALVSMPFRRPRDTRGSYEALQGSLDPSANEESQERPGESRVIH
jgi:hypothetical protein